MHCFMTMFLLIISSVFIGKTIDSRVSKHGLFLSIIIIFFIVGASLVTIG